MTDLIQKLRIGFAGRSARREFWARFVILLMANTVLGVALGIFGLSPDLIGIITLPFWIYIAARRLHDLGLTGWLGLIPFASGTLIGLVALLGQLPIKIVVALAVVGAATITLLVVGWLGCMHGQRQVNRFGPPPDHQNLAEVF